MKTPQEQCEEVLDELFSLSTEQLAAIPTSELATKLAPLIPLARKPVLPPASGKKADSISMQNLNALAALLEQKKLI